MRAQFSHDRHYWESLKLFRIPVEKVEKFQNRCLEDLPAEFRENIRHHFNVRRSLNRGAPLLGELLPFQLLASAETVENPQIREAVIIWMRLYYAVILADDLIDDRSCYGCPKLVLGYSLLLQRTASDIAQRYGEKGSNQLDEALKLSALAAFTENHNGANRAMEDLTSASQLALSKMAIVNLLVFMLSSEGVAISNSIANHLNCWIVLTQLLDDLADLQQDIQLRNQTLPLGNYLLMSKGEIADREIDYVFESNSFLYTLKSTNQQIEKLKNLGTELPHKSKEIFNSYLNDLSETVGGIMDLTMRLRNAKGEKKENLLHSIEKKLDCIRAST